MLFGKYRLLETVSFFVRCSLRSASLHLSPRRGAILSAALSSVWTRSFALSNCPDQHSRCVHSPGLLLKPASLLAIDLLARCPCPVLSPAACRPHICRRFYL